MCTITTTFKTVLASGLVFEFEWAAVLAVLLEITFVLSFAVDQKTTP